MMGLVQGLLFPTENTCHLCERALSGVPGRVLCSACEAALLTERIPQGDIHSPHPPLHACVSAFYHSGEARLLVHRLKYQSDKRAAEPLCAAMAHAFVLAGLTAQADVAVPVPLNVLRLYERGYNQAERLADGVCGHVGLPVRPDLLSRNGSEKTQVGRSREQRLSAMQNAFCACPADGLRVLLVDDVLTTGATATACARALLQAGAVSVTLLTACRA